MTTETKGHPCFDPTARHTSARVHLPVAPRCNVQCRYCNRQTDCLHESRPGVTSNVLTPEQSLEYLHRVRERLPQTRVVGIAGPGDPMANPEESLRTLQLVREAYPEMLLCLATNGLNLTPYLDDLASLGVSHVTVTVNAVEPEIGEKIYDWMRYGKRTHTGLEAASYLWQQQRESLLGLAARGIVPKVNTLFLPQINEDHVVTVARTVAELGARYHNLIPLLPVPGTPFGAIPAPDSEAVRQARARCGLFIPQMAHCQRCRADAAGLLGEDLPEVAELLREAVGEKRRDSPPANNRRVAVASLEGALVNLHLGQARSFGVYQESPEGWSLIDERQAAAADTGDLRWETLAHTLSDCQAVLVSGAGAKPTQVLERAGVAVLTVEGLIDEVLTAWARGDSLGGYLRREVHGCAQGCRSSGHGCG